MSKIAARRLLSVHQGPPAVTDMLLGAAELSSDCRFPGEPSAAVAIRQAKSGGAPKAEAIAASVRDPEVLDHLARKDTRLGVRRTVAANPATAQATLEFLFGWALKSGDECVSPLWSRLPIKAAVSVNRLVPTDGWQHRFNSHPDLPEADLEVLRWVAGCHDMPALASNAAAHAAARGVAVEALLDPMPAPVAATAVQVIAKRCTTVTFDANLAQRLVAAVAERPTSFLPDLAVQLTEDARMVLVASEIDALVCAALVNGEPSAEVRAAARETGGVAALDALCRLAARCADIDPAEAVALMDAIEAVPQPVHRPYYRMVAVDDAEHLLCNPAIPSEVRVRVLRRFNSHLTERWLYGKDCDPARPGEWAALVADPGFALSAQRQLDPPDPEAFDREVQSFVAGLERSRMDAVGVREAYEATPRQIALWAARRGYGDDRESAYLAERFSEAFGENPVLWEMALTLSSNWVGNVAELIATCFATCGIEPAVATAETTPANEAGQMSLL
jgi:hypothetical protein